MSNKIVTTSTLDRFKDNLADVAVTGDYDDISNIPMWRGTRAEHDAEVKSGTLPNNIIVGITDEQSGSDDPDDPTSLSSIQVYSSADQEPLAYENDGTTYYLPRVTFDGTAKGKILGIRFVDADGKMRSMQYDKLWHMGVNVFEPCEGSSKYAGSYYWSTVPYTSYNYRGVTITYLGKGKYKVQGTCTANEGTIISSYYSIGQVSENVIAGVISSANAQLYIKPYNVQGEYGGIKICCYNSSSAPQTAYDAGCGLNETKIASLVQYTLGSSAHPYPIYLYFIGGETYDCTFYLQITPMLDDGKIGDLEHYESPFNTNQFTVFKAGIYEALDSGYTSQSLNNFIDVTSGNASNFGVIDYPIVHSGKNTFTYGGSYTDASKLPTIEIYYVPDYDSYRDIDNLNEVEFSISNGHFNRFSISGGASVDRTYQMAIFSAVHFLKYNNLYLPKGIWEWRYSVSYYMKQAYGYYGPWSAYQNPINRGSTYSKSHVYDSISSDYINSGDTSLSIYIPDTDFQWNMTTSGTSLNSSYDKTVYISKRNYTYPTYVIVPDYDGWDDSVSEND